MVVILIVMLPVSLIVFLIKSIVSELFSPLAELGSENIKTIIIYLQTLRSDIVNGI